MPLLGVAQAPMDMDRMLHQDGSPGSGSGNSQQDLIISSLARRKKGGSSLPPLPPPPVPRTQGRGDMGISNAAYGGMQGSRGPMLNTTCETTVSIPEDSDEQQEVIEVQILPQDENWGETTTAVTTASELDYAMEDLSKWQIDNQRGLHFRCSQYLGPATSLLLALAAFLSPILMVALPQLGVFEMKSSQLSCDVTCDGMLISFSFKLLILLIGSWAVFFRHPTVTLPRIFVFRALVSTLIFVFLLSFWLFYGVHLLEEKNRSLQYSDIVQFALSLIDALLFVHYLAILLLEMRHLSPQYAVKVVRSPDGQSATFPLGNLSVQRAAAHVLERYYTEFPVYNPYLDTIPGARGRRNNATYKVYDIDGSGINDGNSTVVSQTSKGRGHSSHNERYYEEGEYERKVRKRRARLLTTAEESFTHIKRMRQEHTGGRKQALSPYEAAQAVFPSLSRALQKYLRVTRQQPRHTMESILQHLSTCLQYDMSPRAFLERYLVTSAVVQEREGNSVQGWALVCDTLLTRSAGPGTVFQLRQGDTSLLCTVQPLPHLALTEEIIDPKSNKFVLRMSSETSV